MTANITVALISAVASVLAGALTLVGVLVSNSRTNLKIQGDLATAQAVTETKIEELTREVRMHNNFAQRIPVLEEQIKVSNHRVSDLEHSTQMLPV